MAQDLDTPTYLASAQLRARDGDLFNIDAALTEEERAVRDSVRAFVDEKVLPIIGQCYVDGRFPTELIAEMGENGYFGANLPEEYGCAGLNNVMYGIIMQELERGDSGIRSFASVQGALVMYPIYAFGSEEQKKYWLPQMAKGTKIGCFGLTEPDYGSNPAGMITRAREQADGTWILNGAKPLRSVGTRKPRMLAPSSSPASVLAHTTATWAVEPLVIHIFAPFRIQVPSACSRARVIIPAGLEP